MSIQTVLKVAIAIVIAWAVLQGAIIIPLSKILQYLALRRPGLAPVKGFFQRIALKEDLQKDRETIQGGVGCAVLVGIPVAVGMIFAGVAYGVAFLLLVLGALLIFSLYAEGEVEKQAMGQSAAAEAPRKVKVTCPSCAARLAIPSDIRGVVACPACQTRFACSTLPRRAPAWLWAGVLIGAWLMITRPWIAGAVSPRIFAIWSIIGALLCFAVPPISRRRRARRQLRQIDFDVFGDIGLGLAIVAAVGIGFAVFNSYVAGLARLPADATSLFSTQETQRLFRPAPAADPDVIVGAALAAQRQISRGLEATKNVKLGLLISLAVFALASVVLKLGRARLFDRLIAGHKALSKALSLATVLAVSIGSFSLAGASMGEASRNAARSHLFELNARSTEAVEKLTRAVARDLATSAAVRAIETSQPQRAPCETRHSDCPPNLIAALRDEAARAKARQAAWPGKAAAAGLPPADPSAEAGRSAARAADTLAAAAKAAAGSLKSPARTPIERLSDTPISAIDAATEAVASDATEADDPPGRSRLKAVVGLAVDIVSELLPIDLGPHVERAAGALPDAIAENLTDQVKAPFADAGRDAVMDIIAACRGSADACQDFARKRLRQARDDARVSAFGLGLARVVQPLAAGWLATLARAQAANDQADSLLDRAAAPALEAERQGDWGELRQRWRERLAGTEAAGPLAGVNDLLASWRRVAVLQAVNLRAAGQTSPPGAWDAAFLSFLDSQPVHAASFSYMLLNDPSALNLLLRTNPKFDRRRLTYPEVYLLFAAAVPGQSGQGPPGRDVTQDPRFESQVSQALPPSPKDINFPPPPPPPPPPEPVRPPERPEPEIR